MFLTTAAIIIGNGIYKGYGGPFGWQMNRQLKSRPAVYLDVNKDGIHDMIIEKEVMAGRWSKTKLEKELWFGTGKKDGDGKTLCLLDENPWDPKFMIYRDEESIVDEGNKEVF